MNDDSTNPGEKGRANLLVAYDALNRHWVHAEQERWTILNNFLLASTILLLAWAALFGASASVKKGVALILLSVAGLGLSVLWVAISSRASIFVDLYCRMGEDIEEELSLGDGPFTKAKDDIRDRGRVESRLTGRVDLLINWIGSKIKSRVFVIVVPGVFGLIYVLLLLLSLRA